MIEPNVQQQIVSPDGKLTVEGYQLIKSLTDQLTRINTALSGISEPTGGATIDAEARTAINAILAIGE